MTATASQSRSARLGCGPGSGWWQNSAAHSLGLGNTGPTPTSSGKGALEEWSPGLLLPALSQEPRAFPPGNIRGRGQPAGPAERKRSHHDITMDHLGSEGHRKPFGQSPRPYPQPRPWKDTDQVPPPSWAGGHLGWCENREERGGGRCAGEEQPQRRVQELRGPSLWVQARPPGQCWSAVGMGGVSAVWWRSTRRLEAEGGQGVGGVLSAFKCYPPTPRPSDEAAKPQSQAQPRAAWHPAWLTKHLTTARDPHPAAHQRASLGCSGSLEACRAVCNVHFPPGCADPSHLHRPSYRKGVCPSCFSAVPLEKQQ